MKSFFLFIFINLTGVITYKIINFKKPILSKTISTQTELSNNDISILLKYKKDLDNIYDNDKIYEWNII